MKTKMLAGCVASIMALTVVGFGRPQTRDDGWARGMRTILAQAHVQFDDEAALVEALGRSNTPIVASAAAYQLGKLPRSEPAMEALRGATASEDETLMNYAIRTLLGFGDKSWVGAASARLRGMKNSFQQLYLAGELAEAGVYDGWDLVRAAIIADGPCSTSCQEVGLMYYAGFRGMKNADGSEVDLIKELNAMMEKAPATGRKAISDKILQLTRAQAATGSRQR